MLRGSWAGGGGLIALESSKIINMAVYCILYITKEGPIVFFCFFILQSYITCVAVFLGKDVGNSPKSWKKDIPLELSTCHEL